MISKLWQRGRQFVSRLRKRPSSSLRVEVLEDRTIPATGISPHAAFTDQLYRDLLRRAPDPDGLTFWTGRLDSGQLTRGQVAAGFLDSREFQEATVNDLYRRLFQRSADPGGLNFWVSFLSEGGSVLELEARLIGSSEYFTVRAAGTEEGFLRAVYQDTLNRALDPVGAASWNALLLNPAALNSFNFSGFGVLPPQSVSQTSGTAASGPGFFQGTSLSDLGFGSIAGSLASGGLFGGQGVGSVLPFPSSIPGSGFSGPALTSGTATGASTLTSGGVFGPGGLGAIGTSQAGFGTGGFGSGAGLGLGAFGGTAGLGQPGFGTSQFGVGGIGGTAGLGQFTLGTGGLNTGIQSPGQFLTGAAGTGAFGTTTALAGLNQTGVPFKFGVTGSLTGNPGILVPANTLQPIRTGLGTGGTRTLVAWQVLTSREGSVRTVESLYQRFLLRPADQVGIATFAPLTQSLPLNSGNGSVFFPNTAQANLLSVGGVRFLSPLPQSSTGTANAFVPQPGDAARAVALAVLSSPEYFDLAQR